MSETLEITIPFKIEKVSPLEKVKFLMALQFSYRNQKLVDMSKVELDSLLDYVSAINKILDVETHKKVRLIALETLHLVIDTILKYFSASFMSSLKLSERLMLIAILVKRNCFPVFGIPARQPALNFSHITNKNQNDEPAEKRIETLKHNAHKSIETEKFIKATKIDEKILTKSVADRMDRVKLRLVSGIEMQDFSKMTLDDMQVVSLMMNDKDFTLVKENNRIKLVENEVSKGIVASESQIFKPASI